MECFLEGCGALGNHVGVTFPPRGVGHLGHHGLDSRTHFIQAVIEADGIETVTYATELGEHPHRSMRSGPGVALHQLTHSLVQTNAPVAEVVATSKAHQPRARLDETTIEQRRQFLQVQIDEHQRMTELPWRLAASVKDVSLVQAARAVHSVAPKAAATRKALLTPSSWKPDPQ